MVRMTLRGIRLASLVLAAYWTLIFVGTHIPRPPQLNIDHGDKFLHFGAFLGLSFLLCWALPKSNKHRLLHLVVAFAIAIGYGAMDEFTQIPVGRTADVLDWLADATGAGFGLIVYCAARQLLIKIRSKPSRFESVMAASAPATARS